MILASRPSFVQSVQGAGLNSKMKTDLDVTSSPHIFCNPYNMRNQNPLADEALHLYSDLPLRSQIVLVGLL